MNGGWVFLIVLILAVLIGGGGYVAYRKFYLKQETTFAYPSPAPSSLGDKLRDIWSRIRNPKTQTGAGYEATSGYGGGRVPGRGRAHALDPDEAWDSRVGTEADLYGGSGVGGYYEEQELEYHGASTGGGFRQTETLGAPTTGSRARSKSPAASNPFADDNAASLRSVSPRPQVDTAAAARHPTGGRGSAESSPTFERRSIFREAV
ncbi:uncharacterized protein PV09_08608 [Verruconis gallopava]|uniref:Uncharacterized protein n=1 Tax=Verruconis gallopava TaxID=253628 RepID=A0A0D2A0F1_9PEZI|nr:uncharacterized protein PV09_08608 [Verruconis gallopava]KIV99804.1 hypothetical protein PV09_08608 [Verruconis gallopava]